MENDNQQQPKRLILSGNIKTIELDQKKESIVNEEDKHQQPQKEQQKQKETHYPHIDIETPVFTVYGVQQILIKKVKQQGFRDKEMKQIVGTSLYESQSKAQFVKEQYEKAFDLNVQEAEKRKVPLVVRFEYKLINFPVY